MAGQNAEVALDIKKGAGEYRAVRSVLFLMVRAAYAPAGGCEIKRFGIKFEAGWDAEVVSTIEKTPGTVHRQYIPGVFIWVGQDWIHINQEISR